jgi:hypothetical protein
MRQAFKSPPSIASIKYALGAVQGDGTKYTPIGGCTVCTLYTSDNVPQCTLYP